MELGTFPGKYLIQSEFRAPANYRTLELLPLSHFFFLSLVRFLSCALLFLPPLALLSPLFHRILQMFSFQIALNPISRLRTFEFVEMRIQRAVLCTPRNRYHDRLYENAFLLTEGLNAS